MVNKHHDNGSSWSVLSLLLCQLIAAVLALFLMAHLDHSYLYMAAFLGASVLYWARVVRAVRKGERNNSYWFYCILMVVFPIVLEWVSIAEFAIIERLGL